MNGDVYVSRRSWGNDKGHFEKRTDCPGSGKPCDSVDQRHNPCESGYFDEPDGLSGFSRLVENSGSPVWEAVRPALVAADSTFAGDDEAFWAVYSTGVYARGLHKWEGNR